MAKETAVHGIYSATYSNVPVWEFQFGVDLKEHVMRRCEDDYINATHILKAAGFDKPARTRVLEREVQKDTHEKVQGGYGKYQGTWIPLERGVALAQRNNVYDRLRPIFEFQPGTEGTPPPAPKHASKPKAPRPSRPAAGRPSAAGRPAIPKWNSKSNKNRKLSQGSFSQADQGAAPVQDDYDGADSNMQDDDTPDNLTVASASYMGEDDGYDMSHYSTNRKRKREEDAQNVADQQHSLYGDALLDYFLLSKSERSAIRPDPPTNFKPDWPIDTEAHTAIHWAAAMGDVDVIKQLKRFNANIAARSVRGETPLMRAVKFTNCYEKDTFLQVFKELADTVDVQDNNGWTVLHHAAAMKGGSASGQSCSRYYLDIILNHFWDLDRSRIMEVLDMQDLEGNTALHLAAQRGAKKCTRALLGRGAAANLRNHEGIMAEDLIKALNASKANHSRGGPQRSSSPFAPESHRHNPFRDAVGEYTGSKNDSFSSEAANMVQSRMAPLVVHKLQELARSFEEELKLKDKAEKDAQKALRNTQAELASAQAQIAEMKAKLEPEEVEARLTADAERVGKKALAFVTHQNRIMVREESNRELAAMANGDGTSGDEENDTPEERVRLALELQRILDEQRELETQYIDARGVLGATDRIDKYRHLLQSCLPPEDHQLLDENLEDMIKMMEEETDIIGRDSALDLMAL
ncbi:putative apses transcription factor [Immersiella caudata]|uniref:Apses transcription factor n=1 Tax=Immersiella caudata TaxID=314043 RepID=A0AA39WPA9_9PEZI|nr:putative apses transcription factor [Immersiella caudata]